MKFHGSLKETCLQVDYKLLCSQKGKREMEKTEQKKNEGREIKPGHEAL